MDLWMILVLCAVCFALGIFITRIVQKDLQGIRSKALDRTIDCIRESNLECYAGMAQKYQDTFPCQDQCGAKISDLMRESAILAQEEGRDKKS